MDPKEKKTFEQQIAELEVELMNLNDENTQERNRQDTLMEMLTRARLDLEKYGHVMESADVLAAPMVEASMGYHNSQTFG